MGTAQDEPTITDEQHLQTLSDAAAVLDAEGLEAGLCFFDVSILQKPGLEHRVRGAVLSRASVLYLKQPSKQQVLVHMNPGFMRVW